MEIQFCGAAQTVTGSCYFIKTQSTKFLVDCGLFQGPRHIKALNNRGFLFEPKEIDFVLLTHAHIDHSGLLPKLVTEGFKGKIYTTFVTEELANILLPDSAYIQQHDADVNNRKAKRRGNHQLIQPLYTVEDAKAVKPFFFQWNIMRLKILVHK